VSLVHDDHVFSPNKIPHVQTNGHCVLDHIWLKSRAATPLSTLPRPFLRWAGSKRWMLQHILPLLPKEIRIYREPFLGSASLFFLLCPRNAILSDQCEDLIRAYMMIRENVSAIIRHLKPLKPNKNFFYAIRKNPSRGKLKRAAEFLYLNKTCWNGLYRVNSKGQFNVPYGIPSSDTIVDFRNLHACARLLNVLGVQLKHCDYEMALADAEGGDFIYLDPPYVTRHNNNGFIDYNETLFSWEDQKRLANRARDLANAGAYVIVTNADHQDVLDLYAGFKSVVLTRSSTLAADSKFRSRVNEVVLYSPNCQSPG
jgi:DNA adenine methylase